MIIVCVVFYLIVDFEVGELVCLVVNLEYCYGGCGDELLEWIEECVCGFGLKILFVFIMWIVYWFCECGF